MINAINEIWGSEVCDICESKGFIVEKNDCAGCLTKDCETVDEYFIHNKLFQYLKECWDEVH